MDTPTLGARQKALALNLDASTYGTIAEIGGGQEVSRWFFKAGGAAGTVAKTISAYDMAISDGIYGSAKRYVSRERLNAMLDYEFAQLADQLGTKHGDSKRFFAFANTVATRRFHSSEHGRGWMGIRFQTRPHDQPSQITLHAHLHDMLPNLEQEALGVLGINLIHAAFYLYQSPTDLIASLRAGKPINELKNVAEASLTAVMGRMAAYTGKEVTWDKALNSKLDTFPSKLEWDMSLPVPEVATPGKTPLI